MEGDRLIRISTHDLQIVGHFVTMGRNEKLRKKAEKFSKIVEKNPKAWRYVPEDTRQSSKTS